MLATGLSFAAGLAAAAAFYYGANLPAETQVLIPFLKDAVLDLGPAFIVFAYLVLLMLVIGEISPLDEEWQQVDVKAVDMTPWAHARKLGLGLVLVVLAIYVVFADLSVLT